jgi:hypothetical protein
MWSVFGRTGYIRVQIKPGSEVKASEWRLDGFPEQVCDKYCSDPLDYVQLLYPNYMSNTPLLDT